MNKQLLDSIVNHIYSTLAICPSAFINLDHSKSLMSPEYLLPEKLRFEQDEIFVNNKVWGCQLSFMKRDVKILLGDCSIDPFVSEFAMLVAVKDMPTYGLYLAWSNTETEVDSEPMLACTIDNKAWMECTTFLQATFLAGMEQLRDVGLAWSKCADYKDQYQRLLSFIKYHAATYEARNAR